MYGYEICQKTKELTNAQIELTEAAIYPGLHKLEKKGLVTSSKEKVNGRVRKYYQINQTSEEEVNWQIDSLLSFTQSLNVILNPSIR